MEDIITAALDGAAARAEKGTRFFLPGFAAAAIDELAKNVVYYEKRARQAENVLRQVSAAMAGFNDTNNAKSENSSGRLPGG